MDDSGHGTWDRGDQIAVACNDGSFVNFALDGTGDTKRAVFTGTIPNGKQLGSVAVYPADAAVSLSGGQLSLNLSSSIPAAVSSDYPGVMVGAIADSWEVNFKQVLGFLKLTLNNYPGEAVEIRLSSDQALSGVFSAPVDELLSGGLKASQANSGSGLSLSVNGSGKSVYAIVPVPVAEYPSIQMQLLNNKGEMVVEQVLSDYATDITRAQLHAMTTTCEEVSAPPCRINIGGDRTVMKAVSEGIYEGEFEVPASTTFTVEFDGAPYGFASGSGAGGLGTISAANSALPVAKISSAGKSKKTYYVRRAQGTMASTDLADNPFVIDLEAPGKIKVRFDNTDPAAPRYKISLVEDADPAVIFHEDFDLCVFGGDYMAPADGNACSADKHDGYLPATGTVTQNNPCFAFDYPVHVSTNDPLPEYMEAYGFKDWVFVYAGERPGGMQLCSGSVPGSMTTPEVGKAAASATLTVDIARFSATSVDPVYVRLIGGGTFVSGKVTRDAYTAASQAGATFAEAGTSYSSFEDGGTSFKMVDDEYFPHSLNNADIDKPVSHYSFELSGVTAQTKIMIDAPKGAKNAPRVFVFDIKLTQK